MNININNLTINVYIGKDDEETTTIDNLCEERWWDPPYDEFPEEAAAAEETLYTGASGSEAQDEEVTPSYWDEAVEDAVKQPTVEPKTLVQVVDGYYVDQLVGKVGRVVSTDDDLILVEFDGYLFGHNGLEGSKARNRWFFEPDYLTPYSLKGGDKVRHMGDGTGEPVHDICKAYTGYKGESLIGKVGTVVPTDLFVEGKVLVEWEDWTDGHDRQYHGLTPPKSNRWWTGIDNLIKVEQWNS